MIFKIKKGELLIRDVVTMMLLVSVVLIFISTFVTEMASNYGNTAMENEYALKNISVGGDRLFNETSADITSMEDSLTDETNGFWTFIEGSKEVVTTLVITFFTAPSQIGNLVEVSLIDGGVSPTQADYIGDFVAMLLWVVVGFSVIAIFAQGAKV